MIRYVAIGAVVGFLVAFFLLSSGNQEPMAPAVQPPVQVAAPRPTNDEMLQLRPIPRPLEGRPIPWETAPKPR